MNEIIKRVVIADDDIEAGYEQDDDSDAVAYTKTSYWSLTHHTVNCSVCFITADDKQTCHCLTSSSSSGPGLSTQYENYVTHVQ